MQWNKIGRIFSVQELVMEQDCTHTSNPAVIKLSESLYRVFYSTRDKNGKSNVSYFDYDMDSLKVLNYQKAYLLKHGDEGTFDESGIGLGNILEIGDCYELNYMAWQTPSGAHWRGDIGRIKLDKNFNEIGRDILMGIDDKTDKLSLSYPFILQDSTGYHMWYGSTETWDYGNGEMLHVIKYAFSPDLLNWQRKDTCISYEIGESQAFSRPTVLKNGETYHMWYSYRGNSDKYKIGYARSVDGIDWKVYGNKFGTIGVSQSGWDSEMVCYPCVFKHKGKIYMLYNGNGYGASGVGLAVLEDFNE